MFCFQEAYRCFLCLLKDHQTLSGHLSYSEALLPSPLGLGKSDMHPELSRREACEHHFQGKVSHLFHLGDANLPWLQWMLPPQALLSEI